jgi:uncharacterized protein (TIGR02284 family)
VRERLSLPQAVSLHSVHRAKRPLSKDFCEAITAAGSPTLGEDKMPGTLQDYATSITSVIAICRDAEQGFRGAADALKDPMLKELFEQYSIQRGAFANELQTAVKTMGFDPTHPSGVAGVLHGAWMTLKGAMTGNSPHAILVETERGEDWSVKTYRDALATNLPVEIRSIVEQQYEQVLQAHNRIKGLRDATAAEKAPEPHAPAAPPR